MLTTELSTRCVVDRFYVPFTLIVPEQVGLMVMRFGGHDVILNI